MRPVDQPYLTLIFREAKNSKLLNWAESSVEVFTIHNVEFTSLVRLYLSFYTFTCKPIIWQFSFASHLCNILGQRLSSRFGLCTGDGNRRVDEVRVFLSRNKCHLFHNVTFSQLCWLWLFALSRSIAALNQAEVAKENFRLLDRWRFLCRILVFLEIDAFWFVCGFKTTQADWFRAQDAWSKK